MPGKGLCSYAWWENHAWGIYTVKHFLQALPCHLDHVRLHSLFLSMINQDSEVT